MARFGSKRGYTPAQSAAVADRYAREKRVSGLVEAKIEIGRLMGVIEGKDEQLQLLKSLLENSQ